MNLSLLYNGKELTQLRIQYKDFSAWQNQILNTEKNKEAGRILEKNLQEKFLYLTCLQIIQDL